MSETKPTVQEKSINWLTVIGGIILTALSWGTYGSVLHKGQALMKGSRLRPLICVGLAYFVVAVIVPLGLIQANPLAGMGSAGMLAFLAGTAGAIGAFGIILSFTFGGKPIYIMPLVFGGAPVVNTLVASYGNYGQIGPLFIMSLTVVIVGAVMVLVLFVVMMLDIDVARLREGFTQYLPAGLVIAGVMVAELAVVMLSGRFGLDAIPRPVGRGVDYSNTRELGLVLYTDYVYAFEIAALILLVAIIAAISLTFRRRGGTNVQVIADQLQVTKADRLRVVKMTSERTDGGKSP